MINVVLILVFVLLTASALIILKLGAKNGAPIQYVRKGVHFNINRYAVSGVFLYSLSFLVYIYLISKNDLGYIIPLTTALVYVVIFPASYFIFKEHFTTKKVIGIALILGGLLFLNL